MGLIIIIMNRECQQFYQYQQYQYNHFKFQTIEQKRLRERERERERENNHDIWRCKSMFWLGTGTKTWRIIPVNGTSV
jgi:hypothetical protein